MSTELLQILLAAHLSFATGNAPAAADSQVRIERKHDQPAAAAYEKFDPWQRRDADVGRHPTHDPGCGPSKCSTGFEF